MIRVSNLLGTNVLTVEHNEIELGKNANSTHNHSAFFSGNLIWYGLFKMASISWKWTWLQSDSKKSLRRYMIRQKQPMQATMPTFDQFHAIQIFCGSLLNIQFVNWRLFFCYFWSNYLNKKVASQPIECWVMSHAVLIHRFKRCFQMMETSPPHQTN